MAVTAARMNAAEPTAEPFGKTAAGEPVEIYTIKNEAGFTAKVMTRGATLVQLLALIAVESSRM